MRRLVLALSAAAALALPAAAPADQACGSLLPVGLLQPAGGFTVGCARLFTLKLGAALGPDGNYILLDLPVCASGPCGGTSGLAQLQCAANLGYDCCLVSGLHVPTIQGTNVATLVAGLDQRLARDTDTRAGICAEDYAGNGARFVEVTLADFPGSIRTEMVLSTFLPAFIVGPPAGTGTSTTFTLEFLSAPTPARPASWGRVKQLYR